MPIYEYQCESCGNELEKLQRMNDPDLTDCPECGKSTLKRLVSAAAFRLKGSGWYETDFKKEGKKNLHHSSTSDSKAEKTDKSDSSKSEKKAEPKKTESKPASTKSDSA
jgi:putative FmdB family regulatory protein